MAREVVSATATLGRSMGILYEGMLLALESGRSRDDLKLLAKLAANQAWQVYADRCMRAKARAWFAAAA